jgi:hypothetical protein
MLGSQRQQTTWDPDVAEVNFELDNDVQSMATSRRNSLSSGSGISAQDYDRFCGPDESELELGSNLEREVNFETPDEWEVDAANWKNLDDEASNPTKNARVCRTSA